MSIVFSGNGYINSNGTVPISQGGTGSTTAVTALNALLPPQNEYPGHILSTDGFNAIWIPNTGGSGGGNVPQPGPAQNGYFLSTNGESIFWTPLQIDPSLIGAAGVSGQLQYNFENSIVATQKIFYKSADVLTVGDGTTDTFKISGETPVSNSFGGTSVLIKGGDSFANSLPIFTPPAGDVILQGGGGIGQGAPGDIIVRVGKVADEVFRISGVGAWSLGNTGISTGTENQVLLSKGNNQPPQWGEIPTASDTKTGGIKITSDSGMTLTTDGVLVHPIRAVDNTTIKLTAATGTIYADIMAMLPPRDSTTYGKFLQFSSTPIILSGGIVSGYRDVIQWAMPSADEILPLQSSTTADMYLYSNGTTALWKRALPQQTPDAEGKFLKADGVGGISWDIPEFQVATATSEVLGLVKVDDTSIKVTQEGVISADIKNMLGVDPNQHTGKFLQYVATDNGDSFTEELVWADPSYPSVVTGPESEAGLVKIDGTSIVSDPNGVLSSVYTLPSATTAVLGGIKVDGTTIIADENGVITATGTGPDGYTLPPAGLGQDGNLGGIRIGSGFTYSSGLLSVTLPIATTTEAGLVKVGGGLLVSSEGVLSTATIPTAGPGTLGLVRLEAGSNPSISIDANGVIRASANNLLPAQSESTNGLFLTNNGAGVLSWNTPIIPKATTSALGGVIIDNSTLSVDTTGKISVKSVTLAGKNNAVLFNSNNILSHATNLVYEDTKLTVGDVNIPFAIESLSSFSLLADGTLYIGTNSNLVIAINESGAISFGSTGTSYGAEGQTLISAGDAASPAWGVLGVAGGGTGTVSYTGKYITVETVDGVQRLVGSDTIAGEDIVGDVAVNADNVSGIVDIENGGTGADNPTDALNNLLPDQTGNEDKFLASTGSGVYWATVLPSGSLPVASTSVLGAIRIDGNSLVIDSNGVVSATGAGLGTVNSVGLSGGDTGLTVSMAVGEVNPITNTGTFTLGGVLKVENGGTGASTAITARANLDAAKRGANSDITSLSGLTTALTVQQGGTGGATPQEARTNILPAQAGRTNRFLQTNGTDVSWQEMVNIPISGNDGDMLYVSGGAITPLSTFRFNGTTAITLGGVSESNTSQQFYISTRNSLFTGINKAPLSIVLRPGTQTLSNSESANVYVVGGPITSLSGTGGDVYLDGGLASQGSGGSVVIRTTDGPSTALVNRLAIEDGGAWAVNGNSGTEGQVLVSTGSGSSPEWRSSGIDATNIQGTGLPENITSSYLTSLGTLSSLRVEGPTELIGTVGIGTDAPQAPLVVASGQDTTGIELQPVAGVAGISKISVIDRALTATGDRFRSLDVSASSISFSTAIPVAGAVTNTRLKISESGAWELATDAGLPGKVLTSNGADNPPTWEYALGTIDGGTTGLTATREDDTITLGGTLAVENGGTGATTRIGASNSIANFGQLQQHNAFNDFNKVKQWGATFVAGGINAPINAPHYQMTLALGSEYGWGSGSVYAAQIAIPRNVSSPYLSVRYKEGGGDEANWGTWQKISAGSADTLSATLPVTKGGTGKTSAAEAAVELLSGADSTNYGKYLYNDNGTLKWSAPVVSTSSLTGKVPIANGGTNADTAAGAIYNLTSAVTSTTNTVLRYNGTTVSLAKLALNTDVTGVLGVGNGGTGGINRTEATRNILPEQSVATNNKALRSNGLDAVWGSAVSSIEISGENTGLTFTGGPVTASGTFTLGGKLNVANGGTGANYLLGYVKGNGANAMTASATIPLTDTEGTLAINRGGTGATERAAAIKALLPPTGSTEQFLRTDGSGNIGWGYPATAATSITGTVPVANGGTGLSTLTAGNRALYSTDASTLVAGTLPIAAGGTAATTPAAAINNLFNGVTSLTVGTAGTTSATATMTIVGNSNVSTPVPYPVNIHIQGGTQPLVSSKAGDVTLQGGTTSGGGVGTGGNVILNGGSSSSYPGYIVIQTYAMTGILTERLRVLASGAVSFGSGGNKHGNDGEVLTSTGAGTPPVWKAISAGATLPSQTGNDGKYLKTNGTTASWETVSAGAAVSGSNTEIQYNNSGALGASAALTYNGTSLAVGTTSGITLNGNTATISAVATNGNLTLLPKGTGSVVLGSTGSGIISSGAGEAITVLADTDLTLASGGNIILKSKTTEFARISSTGAWGITGSGTINYGTAGQVLSSGGPNSPPVWSPAGGFSGGTIPNAVTLGSTLAFGAAYTETNTTIAAAATTNIDCALGNNFSISMAANVTSLTFTNIPATGRVYCLTLVINQDATGGRTFAWPAAVRWAGGTTPAVTATANKFDIYTLMTNNGGTHWFGFVAGQNF